MAIPTVTYSISFSTDQDLSSGMLTITDTTAWLASFGIDPADVEIAWGFTGPDLVAYRVATFGMPGNIFPDVSTSSTVPLPTDIDGNVQTGDYTVTVIARVGGAVDPGDYEPDPTVHELCADFPAWDFDEDVNCLAAWVAVTDNTPWEANGWTVDSRQLTLQYPLSTVQHADITSATASVSTAGEPIFRGQWKVLGEWEVTKDNLTVTISGYKTFDVFCNADACKRWCQIECAWQAWQDVKDNPTLSGRAREKWETMLKLSMMLDRAEACGDRTLVPVLSAAYAEASKNCGCGCTENTDLITPIYGSSGNAPLIVAGQGIVVAYGAGTVTISLTQAEIDFFTNSYNTAISSPLGTLTIGAAVVTGSNPELHTIPVDVAKVPPDYMEFLWIISDTTGPVVALGTPTIMGTTFQIPGTILPAGELYVFSNLMAGSAVAYNVEVTLESWTLRNPYNLTHRYHKMIEPQIVTVSTTQFTVGIFADDDVFGTEDGAGHKIDWFDRHLSSFTLLFKLTKRT